MDATPIAALSSTKNDCGTRDPELHQFMKGNQYYVGMKAPVGVNGESRLVHTLLKTPANNYDITQA
jgi:IS5 family transposase